MQKVYSVIYYEDVEDMGTTAYCLGVFTTKEKAVKKMHESFKKTKESKIAAEIDPIEGYNGEDNFTSEGGDLDFSKSEDYCRIFFYFDWYEWRLDEWELDE